MIKISVTGGKGGTGKSTIATNLALVFAEAGRRVVLADLDVEAPNDHVLLGVALRNEKPVEIMLPFIDYPKCIECGVCGEVCDTGAIILSKEKRPFVIPRLCSGCRSCYYACPVKAIIEGRRIIGYTYETLVDKYGLRLVTGVLREGEEHTPPVVLAARERAAGLASDLLLVDTSAGTGNHVALALEDSKLVLAVTEPTPLGLHDLKLILDLVETLGLEAWIVINRHGIGGEDKIVEEARARGARIAARLAYAEEVVDSYVKGVPIVALYPEHPVSKTLRVLGEEVLGAV